MVYLMQVGGECRPYRNLAKGESRRGSCVLLVELSIGRGRTWSLPMSKGLLFLLGCIVRSGRQCLHPTNGKLARRLDI